MKSYPPPAAGLRHTGHLVGLSHLSLSNHCEFWESVIHTHMHMHLLPPSHTHCHTHTSFIQADYFFVPPLNLLAEKLRLSPSVAGITLLAIGNGMDVIVHSYELLQLLWLMTQVNGTSIMYSHALYTYYYLEVIILPLSG